MGAIDDVDATAMQGTAEWLVAMIDAADAVKDPRVAEVLAESRELVVRADEFARAGNYLDAAKKLEELADAFRARGMTLTAERFDKRAADYRYESRIRRRAQTRRERRGR